MMAVYVPFRMSDGKLGVFTVARTLAWKNRVSLFDQILEESGFTDGVQLRDFGADELVLHFIVSGQAEVSCSKRKREAVVV